MALSHYLKLFAWPENPRQWLAYSTRRGSYAQLPGELVAALQQGRAVPPDTMALLEKLAFVTADRNQEKEDIFSFNQRLNRLSTIFSLAVIVNMDCNFQCRYCYEGTQKDKLYMTDKTAEQVVAFIKERIGPQIKKVILDFYGGEPLLSGQRIASLAAALQPCLQEQGVALELTLVTNGSLMTARAVNDLLPWGLTSCKVTLDGPANNHNAFRPFKNGAPSYELIVRNIKECCELTRIGIGGNFTRDNYHLFPQLLDDLQEQGLTPDKLAMVKFDPVLQTTDRFADLRFCGGCASIEEPWLAEASLLLRGEVLKRGYHTPKISPTTCMVDMDNSLTIHYDGSLYKCLSLIGHREYACGDIWSGMKPYREQYQLDHWQKEEKCRECVYLPLCFGGCRFMAFQRDGNMARVDCRQDYLDATLQAMLLQDIRYRHGQAS
ncbi:MAG: geopeptide radical SAM maturase [Desulfobulbaceae bacterium]|nr:geopeptide radical SAM maturase [Desulfobulbaceae bacterium]